MKLLTLNTHSLQESDMDRKRAIFVDFVLREQPDVIALQEVNQNMNAPVYEGDAFGLRYAPKGAILRADNHALACARELAKNGLAYEWAWLPMKVGYSRYDEGLAIFSRKPVLEADNILASQIDDYTDFRTRRLLGIRNADGWFYSIHLSWWNDPNEPFLPQWNRLMKALETKHVNDDVLTVLMGDFNSDAFIHGESADEIRRCGWIDSYAIAQRKDGGMSVGGVIDGWEDQPENGPKRIDQIWLNKDEDVQDSRVVFNGINEEIVSDHYGVLVDLQIGKM